MYAPQKYFSGLSKSKKVKRLREIRKFTKKNWKDPSAYTGFQTDIGVRTKRSTYSRKWTALFPQATSLAARAAVTGVPLRFIEACYNRGLAAWRTGHRPGATQHQWGYARVASFLLCGKTYHTTDSDLAEQAKKESVSAKKWFETILGSLS